MTAIHAKAAGHLDVYSTAGNDSRRPLGRNEPKGAIMKFIPYLIVLALVACADAPMVQISPDTYLIARSDKGGIFGNAAAMKVEVIREASEFAASQGKIAIPISTNETPVYPGHLATIEYQFKLVDPDSPEAKSTALETQPDKIVERRNEYGGDVTVRHETDDKPDLYTELMKLDDLHRNGILTDDEFEEQKKKILERN